jgi:RNA polymerase sigma-70 factor (ECF subfamily)
MPDRAMKPSALPGGAIDPEEKRHRLAPESDRIEILYRDERRALARYFGRRMPASDVDDLVQESFRRTLGHVAVRPGAFLNRVARNLLFERRRSAGRKAEAAHVRFEDDAIADIDPHRLMEARDALARVDQALDTLHPKTRNIFLLRRIEGMSYAEIASAYGMSEKGVEKQFAKAMIHLRRRVGDL